MSTQKVAELSKDLVEFYAGNQKTKQLVYHLVRELAKGQPVTPARMGELLQISTEEATTMLDGATIQDDQGRVTGFGLSLDTTDHEYKTNGKTFGLWCAVDALVFPTLIGAPASIKSKCAATGEPIELELTPTEIKSLKPETAVVSIMSLKIDQAEEHMIKNLQKLLCSGQLFFKSAEAAKSWHAEHPQASILPVRDAFNMYVDAAKKVWGI